MFSIIIPIYNEEKRLSSTVTNLISWLRKRKINYEILLADDGSTDKTAIVINTLSKKDKHIRSFFSSMRLGRGTTLNAAINVAYGEYIIYMDADMATNPSDIASLLYSIQEDYAIVTGSRYHTGSKIKRETLRYFLSKIYNLLIRLFFSSIIKDHQCGFKAFQKVKIAELLPQIRSSHWFWDSEILIKAQKRGLKVKEIPIEWNEIPGSKVNLLRDIYEMSLGIIILWMDIYVKRFY